MFKNNKKKLTYRRPKNDARLLNCLQFQLSHNLHN